MIDFISLLPLELIFLNYRISKLVRIARVTKFYRFVRATRMIKMLKVFQDRQRFAKNMTEIIRIGIGFERLLFILLIYVLV